MTVINVMFRIGFLRFPESCTTKLLHCFMPLVATIVGDRMDFLKVTHLLSYGKQMNPHWKMWTVGAEVRRCLLNKRLEHVAESSGQLSSLPCGVEGFEQGFSSNLPF